MRPPAPPDRKCDLVLEVGGVVVGVAVRVVGGTAISAGKGYDVYIVGCGVGEGSRLALPVATKSEDGSVMETSRWLLSWRRDCRKLELLRED
jgi:hypothetical protein